VPSVEAYEEDRAAVLADLERGQFDHLEVASRVTEANFFRFLLEEGDLPALAATYPTPRKKEEVPLWLYLASQISMRLHGAHAYSNYPYILHCGGLRDALGPGQVQLVTDPESGRRQLDCKGYNRKNQYPHRATPCDQDFLRKLAKDTPHEALMRWYGSEVARFLHGLGAFEEDGIFLVDGTYLFVPENERYEKSARLRFDKHNHPLTKPAYEKLTEREKAETRWRRCYRAVFLLHLGRTQKTSCFAGFRLLGGKESETPQLRDLVDRFVASVGRGVIRTLVFDRGFLDGATITHLKKEHGIDCVFPLRSDMLDAKDAFVLADADPAPWTTWKPAPRPKSPDPPDRPEAVRRREKKRQRTLAAKRGERGPQATGGVSRVEMKLLRSTGLWEELDVPLWVVPMRATREDGKGNEWCLASTREPSGPVEVYETYRLRVAIEEWIRQGKCFWDLSGFRSRSFSLITAQVCFVLLAYSLIQNFFQRIARGELNAKTRDRILNELMVEDERLVLYSANRFAYFTPVEYQRILLEMKEGARRRLLARTKQVEERMIRHAKRSQWLTEEHEDAE
jgi:hypothetical protein